SSLDSESELHIKQSLRKLMQGRTSFVIAHRLSTILQADRILVLDRGEIIDAGRHSELLGRCSLYQRLYRLQFSGEDQTAPPA
ncbi:MAG: ABC transporter ATP-binding protein, partial [Candidatus Hinthialibacter sp.]